MFLTRTNFYILGKTQTGVFSISGFLVNSRTSDDVDMKLGLVTKFEKRNKTKPKKFDGNVMSENCDVIAIFPIHGQFGAIQKPDSRR